MPELEAKPHAFLRFISAALGLLESSTIQGAICISIGGALLGIGFLLGIPMYRAPLLFFAGMALPLWPMRIYYSPERVLERKFARWDRWVEQGIIKKQQCVQWKEDLRSWYVLQVIGPSPVRDREAPAIPSGEVDSDD